MLLIAADIQDAPSWKQCPLLRTKWNLGLSLNTDGMSVYKSSNYEVWPILVSILNLPPSMRYSVDNLLLSTVFPGPKPPKHFIVLFKPLMQELRTLYSEGIIFIV